jgi:drug/metabolite transporter (DMT)-like permease
VLTATLLALGSAFLHAGWNFLIKTGEDRTLVGWGQFLFAGLVSLPVLAVVGPPGTAALPYLAASASVHVVYVLALVRSYHHGDFSLAYPMARGTGALLAALGGVLLLDDHLGVGSWVAIGVVVVGIFLLVGRAVQPPLVGWALLTGATIGTYTLIDSAGSRRTEGLPYGLSLIVATAITVSAVNVARGLTPALRSTLRTAWPRYAAGGAATSAAYCMALVAVRYAPVGYVATLRESSILLAAILGWRVLKDPLGARRTRAALVMTAGLVLLILTRT